MTHPFSTLDRLGQLSAIELDALPLAQLDAHIRHLGEAEDAVRLYKAAMHGAQDRRFSGRAHALRQQAGKSTGTVRFEEGGFVVIADLPKRAEYDQEKLLVAVEGLRKWGENPGDYVGIEIKVAESRYTAWPPGVRQLFEPARTLKTGKPTYRLEPIPAGEALAAAAEGVRVDVQPAGVR